MDAMRTRVESCDNEALRALSGLAHLLTPKYLSYKMRLARVSDLFLFKQDFVPQFCKESLSKSFKALTLHGWITGSYNGGYYALPQLQRSTEKLSALVAHHMDSLGAFRVTLPSLCKSSLLEQSKRWKSFPELFTLKDRRGGDFALAPTCEEEICHLITTLGKPLPSARLPLLLYQITTKFRDELHPRNGLLRGREFLMKDLYSFDVDSEHATKTYHRVVAAYHAIFTALGLQYYTVEGSVGLMGGSLSHEFHVPSAAGENDLLVCSDCRSGYSTELLDERSGSDKHSCSSDKCPKCGKQLVKENGIEIGHTFLLGTKYSKAFNLRYKGHKGEGDIVWMGCFGIGVTRAIATCIEHFGTEDRISLPPVIAPYLGVVIPQKEGHRFADSLSVAERVASTLSSLPNGRDFVIDDRNHLSIGRRLQESYNAGIPMAIVAGKTALDDPPKLEVYWRPCGASVKQSDPPLFISSESDLVNRIQSHLRQNGVNV